VLFNLSSEEEAVFVFREAFPILSTPDMQRALAFYRDLLDGRVVYQFPPDGEPGYVGLDIGASHLGLGLDPQAQPDASGQRFALWVYADDCDTAIRRLRSAGVRIIQEPSNQPWGERVARVLDPDGNQVVVGQRAPE
jgi:lactoylglutathione lyase